jgi:hypothetical protein
MPSRVTKNGRRGGGRQRQKDPPDPVGAYASDAWSLAKRTAFGLNEIRKLINIETKYFDVTSNSVATQAGTVTPLTLVAQGLDQTDRVGDSLKIQRLELRATSFSGVTVPVALRIVVFRDLENQGVVPAGSDLLSAAGVGSAVSCYNWINIQKRFSILYDQTVTMDASNQTAVLGYDMPHGGHVRFRGTTGTQAAQAEGSIYLMLLTDAAATQPVTRFHSRVTYTDD